MINIDDLLVSQESVDGDKIRQMEEYVRMGGVWTADVLLKYNEKSMTRHGREGILSPLIAITRFIDDGTLMVQNGHHRLRSTRGIRNFLLPEEYIISDWRVAEYLEINFDRTYVTPYDPRKQIRLLDFGAYKKKVMALAAVSQEEAMKYILAHPDEYCKDRTIHKVLDMKVSFEGRQEMAMV